MKYKLLRTINSPINGQIQIRQTNDQYYHVVVDDIVQSGPIMPHIWSQALSHFHNHTYSPSHILVLGYGAGSTTPLIHHLWPKTRLIGVEIDPIMIQLRSYFPHQPKSKVTIYNQDIIEYINNPPRTPNKTTLALIDCSKGAQTPNKTYHPTTIKKIKKHANSVIINLLNTSQTKENTSNIKSLLNQHFSTHALNLPDNLFIKINL